MTTKQSRVVVGQTFGGYTVLSESEKKTDKRVYKGFLCRCKCGQENFVTTGNLLRGLAKQCRSCSATARATLHNCSRTPAYNNWRHMLTRCCNPRSRAFAAYGAKGITVCERWRTGFENFLEDMGPRPSPKHQLDRYPNQTGNYEPGNVRWATARQQARNRRNNVNLTVDGKTQSIAAWSAEAGINASTLQRRVATGMSPERAVKTPVRRQAGPLKIDGETRSWSEWARRSGLSIGTLQRRIESGMDASTALSKPANQGHRLDGSPRNQDRKDAVQLTVGGRTRCLAAWARESGLSESCIRGRLRSGWSVEQALTKPSRKGRKSK
jgi:hypothetical protein